MGQQRNWKKEEIQYLEDNWGKLSIISLMKNLNRTENAILIKAQKLGLGPFLESGDYVTWHQLLIALGIDSGGYKNKSWIENRNFPIHRKRVNNCSFKIVYIDEFWKWAEKNKYLLDFSKFVENTLGAEPEWAKVKRKHDFEKNRKYIMTPWTKTEDEKLHYLLKQYKYTYDDLSKKLRRTNGAIQRRICDLGFKERPIKADNHIKWTDEEKQRLKELIMLGYGYELMAEIIGKSSKALRGTVYRFYGSENLDKVRSVIE
ncbi:hypothetical protein [Anaerosporobacter faecicola]|uniref:hypothetical protein n=1 Tax=Anaerosporobacter faecicola TaxID=2718714 RepID=UPI0014397AB9|nr:hypothetical protein [Anaerosporobacter faecicola]